jgi:hypothetical protein
MDTEGDTARMAIERSVMKIMIATSVYPRSSCERGPRS